MDDLVRDVVRLWPGWASAGVVVLIVVVVGLAVLVVVVRRVDAPDRAMSVAVQARRAAARRGADR